MPSKNYTLFFILSVLFVLVSIGFITILSARSSNSDSQTDIRAKAGVQTSIRLTGIVSSYDSVGNTLVLNNVAFDTPGSEVKSMGTFTVTVAQRDFRQELGRPGTNVLLSVDASTFNTAQKTMTASQISKQ